MPRELVYTVDFNNGNLVPSLDTKGWGSMKLGDSGPAHSPTSTPDPQGLNLAVTASGSAAGIGAYGSWARGSSPSSPGS